MCCCPTSPKCIAKCLFKIGFGGSLALVGVAHFKDMQGFSDMVAGGFTGVLANLAGLWAYILPLLMIVGGALLVVGYRLDIAAWAAGVALVSIALGMALKAILGTLPLGEVMPAVQNALLWSLLYLFVVKCGGCCKEGGTGGGGHSCGTC